MGERQELGRAWSAGGHQRAMLGVLGDTAMLVRFADTLSDQGNRDALAFYDLLVQQPIRGVVEVVPNLVSVLIRYDPAVISYQQLSGEIGLLMTLKRPALPPASASIAIVVEFGLSGGPDLDSVAAMLGLTVERFLAAHNRVPLRVLTTGFAPGFVYCGFHPDGLLVPRRETVRAEVPAGSVLFAAGQTAIAATALPTGWHVIGRTDFRNFDVDRDPPTRLRPGDRVQFMASA